MLYCSDCRDSRWWHFGHWIQAQVVVMARVLLTWKKIGPLYSTIGRFGNGIPGNTTRATTPPDYHVAFRSNPDDGGNGIRLSWVKKAFRSRPNPFCPKLIKFVSTPCGSQAPCSQLACRLLQRVLAIAWYELGSITYIWSCINIIMSPNHGRHLFYCLLYLRLRAIHHA